MVVLVKVYPYGICAIVWVYCAGTRTAAPPALTVCNIPLLELTKIWK